MAGRHGNRGVVARILPEEDMPFLPDGTPVEVVLNPLGIPSGMNIGQLLEANLGWAAKVLGLKVVCPVFGAATREDIRAALRKAGLREDGKVVLRDGRTGEPLAGPCTVGYLYMMKLTPLAKDLISAVSTGPYSILTQQPAAGQYFGDTEVWALAAHGAAYTLREMLTVKSDDVVGRVQTYEAIVDGMNLPEPGITESFKAYLAVLRGLALDVVVVTEDGRRIEFEETEPFRRSEIEAPMEEPELVLPIDEMRDWWPDHRALWQRQFEAEGEGYGTDE